MANAAISNACLGGSVLQKRCIGNIEVSWLGLGTTKFGRNQAVKYPQPFSLPTLSELQDLIACAQELGINLIDTAPAYGESENRLGKLLQGRRHDWVICTKAGEEFSDGVSHYDFSSKAITQSVERSLQRIQTDYLDFLLIHSNGEDEKIIDEENVFETLTLLKRQGKIRQFGMSTKTIAGGCKTIEKADLAMVTYNPSHQAEKQVIDLAHKKAKGILVKKAFASGFLAPQKSIAFLKKQAGISSVIVGTINREHLKANASYL